LFDPQAYVIAGLWFKQEVEKAKNATVAVVAANFVNAMFNFSLIDF
jgi:hypothetical protein